MEHTGWRTVAVETNAELALKDNCMVIRILAQLKAGDRVRFEKVSITTAQEALLAQRAALRCLRGAMNR